MTAPALFDLREVVQRNSARMRLRTLLADRRWHRTWELLKVAGSGVSSRLHELREGADGMPALDIECERDGRGYRYRCKGEWIPGANLDGGQAEAVDLARACPPLAGGRCPPCPSEPCAAAGVRS